MFNKQRPIDHKPPVSGSITISYNFISIAFIILIISITIVKLLDFKYSWGITLTQYISICSFGSVTIGLLYNAISLQYNYVINKLKFDREEDALDRDKIKFTYEVTSDWHKADMAMNAELARRFIGPYKGQLKHPEKLTEFKEKLQAVSGLETNKALRANLNYFENLALLAADNVINEDILKKCFRTAFMQYYDNLKEFIEDEQRGNSGGNAKIYINFVSLCKKWNDS